MPNTDPITIKVFTGSGFVEEETHASNVAEYRTEKELPDDIRISVNSKNVADSKALADGDYVAAVANNKTGGGITVIKLIAGMIEMGYTAKEISTAIREGLNQ